MNQQATSDRSGARMQWNPLGSTPKHRTIVLFVRNHCSAVQVDARRGASKPLSARNRCSSTRRCMRQNSETPPQRNLFTHCYSKSLLKRARQPLGTRNHCVRVRRNHLALEIAARANLFVFDSARKHKPHAVFSHVPFEITAQVCSAATGRSKFLLGHDFPTFENIQRSNNIARALVLFDDTFVFHS